MLQENQAEGKEWMEDEREGGGKISMLIHITIHFIDGVKRSRKQENYVQMMMMTLSIAYHYPHYALVDILCERGEVLIHECTIIALCMHTHYICILIKCSSE